MEITRRRILNDPVTRNAMRGGCAKTTPIANDDKWTAWGPGAKHQLQGVAGGPSRLTFFVASIAKSVTSAAVLALVEAQQLRLDDSVRSILPGLPA